MSAPFMPERLLRCQVYNSKAEENPSESRNSRRGIGQNTAPEFDPKDLVQALIGAEDQAA